MLHLLIGRDWTANRDEICAASVRMCVSEGETEF